MGNLWESFGDTPFGSSPASMYALPSLPLMSLFFFFFPSFFLETETHVDQASPKLIQCVELPTHPVSTSGILGL